MPYYKVTIGFQRSVWGPTESYITPNRAADQAKTLIGQLLEKRFNLLSSVVSCTGVRVSQLPTDPNVPAARRLSVFRPPPFGTVPATSTSFAIPPEGRVTQGPNISPDQARACLHVATRFDTDRYSRLYWAFAPDSVIKGEPDSYNPDGNPAWANEFIAFGAWIVSNGFVIRAQKNTGQFEPKAIENWVKSTTEAGNIGFVLPNAPASGITKGNFVRISNVRRRGTDKLSYNGRYLIDSVNTTLVPDSTVYFLRGTEVGDVESIKLLGQVKRIAYDYYPINTFEAIGAGTHKRGKPLGSPSGKRSTRSLLDP